MQYVTLGRTGLKISRLGFGGIPIQRVSAEYAGQLLRKAYEAGVNFFDTARSYTDSEEKMGLALADVREQIIIATKTPSTTVEGFWKDLETSLRYLQTDYVDILQFHNPAFCPKPGDESGLYDAIVKAKEQGKVRQLDTPEQIRQKPADAFVQELVKGFGPAEVSARELEKGFQTAELFARESKADPGHSDAMYQKEESSKKGV